MHNRFETRSLALTLLCSALWGCAGPLVIESLEEFEVMAPLPTFLTLQDCELAYGKGACGTGSQVYGQVNLASPPDAYHWYMPYSFGTMTGALLNDYYAQPGIYLAQTPYWSYVQPATIQRYALINPRTVGLYRAGPHQFRGGAYDSPRFDRAPWYGQLRSEPWMRPAPPRSLNQLPVPAPQTQPAQPGPLTKPDQPIPHKPSPMPAIANPAPSGQRPDRLDRADRPDRGDRPGAGSIGNRASDRKQEDKK